MQASWKLHEPSYAKPDECGLWVWESDKKLQSLGRLLLSPNEWIDKYVRRMSSLSTVHVVLEQATYVHINVK